MFLLVGAVNAAESINVSNTEDSNLIGDDDQSLSANNKLEISNEGSISETNIVNSHDDNLGNYPDEDALSADSYYEDNKLKSTSDDVEVVGENTLGSSASSSDSVAAEVSSSNVVSADSSAKTGVVSASPASTKLSVSDAHYGKSATYFDITLKDNSGKALTNQLVSLKVNNKVYSAYTNSNGVASVKTASLKVGSYAVSVNYGGTSSYSSSSLSKKVKVLSSISGSDFTRYCGQSSQYKVKFWKDNSALANAKVTFKVNGKTYTKKTDKNGVASLKANFGAGKYKVTIVNPYSSQKESHKIIVKKDKTNVKATAKTSYIIHKDKMSFSVVLKTNHNVLLKGKKVSFTYDKKTVTSKTDAKGKATITIPVLAKGTHKISFKYKGGDNYRASSGKAKLVVVNPENKLSSSIVVMHYGESSNLKVKLTNDNGKALANKDVKIKLNGKTTICKTGNDGVAKLSLKNVKPGNHVVKYSYSTKGLRDYAHGSTRAIILHLVAKISANDLTMKYKDGSVYKVTVKDTSGKALKGIYVKSTINGKSYIYQSDSNGVAQLKVTNGPGYYSVKSIVADPIYKSSPVSKHISVKGTKFIAKNVYVPEGDKSTYSVKLVNEKNKPVQSKNVVFNLNGKKLTGKTNSKGIAKVSIGPLSKGTHKITYQHESASGSSKLYVVSKVTVKDLVASSKNVKKYISKHSKLPSTVKIGDVSFKTADYLYLAAKATVNLKSGNSKDISVKILKNPTKPKDAAGLGYLKDYLGVAKKVVKTAESKGVLPNSVNSKVGSIGYKGLVSAFANVLTSYGKYHKMPSYVSIKSLSGSGSTKVGGLNSKNTIKDLSAYLAASKNCEVNDAQIKKLVSKLTKNCKTEKEKATKIFNYIRDTLSYSFYYNTKYGAAGTLKAKSGNCVDHAHLTVAMFRAAGLATRYVHAKCTFNSGHTYGHVWGQVLIGNTWTVADATSSRNSLGHVANWNTHTYKLESYSSSISF